MSVVVVPAAVADVFGMFPFRRGMYSSGMDANSRGIRVGMKKKTVCRGQWVVYKLFKFPTSGRLAYPVEGLSDDCLWLEIRRP